MTDNTHKSYSTTYRMLHKIMQTLHIIVNLFIKIMFHYLLVVNTLYELTITY